MSELLQADEVQVLRASLLDWYASAGRELPWRSEPTPYRVWVSEIMCQQTRIATVLPYFERWMEAFPDPSSLAAASLDDVLALWAGLGYYSRARNLHKAAGIIEDQHDGELPADHAGLLELPGVGRYTAGAIASIAFSLPEPVVDGNVIRVLARVFGLEGDPTRNPVKKTLWELAEELVPQEEPGDFNQGLMELGALICRPRQPACDECPWAEQCVARATDRVEELPSPKAKPRRHRVISAGLVIERNGQMLLVRRETSGLLGGLWTMPWKQLVKRPVEESGDDTGLFGSAVAGDLAIWAEESLGLVIRPTRPLSPVDHTFTHIDYTLIPWLCELENSGKERPEPLIPAGADSVRWVAPEGLEALGLPRMMEKALAKL